MKRRGKKGGGECYVLIRMQKSFGPFHVRELWNGLVWFMVFNATFNNISVISWQSVLVVGETRVPEKTTNLPQVTDKRLWNEKSISSKVYQWYYVYRGFDKVIELYNVHYKLMVIFQYLLLDDRCYHV